MRNETEEQGLGYTEALKEMLFITSHKVRKPISTCLGLMSLLDPDYKTKICREELEMIFLSLKPSLLELDEYVKELTLYIANVKIKEDERLKTVS